MQEEYDFSNAERGKFYNPDATLHLPVYLEPDVLEYFSAKAKNEGVELNSMINDLLKNDIARDEGVQSNTDNGASS